MEELIQKIKTLENLVYKMARRKELTEVEDNIIDNIIEKIDYPGEDFSK